MYNHVGEILIIAIAIGIGYVIYNRRSSKQTSSPVPNPGNPEKTFAEKYLGNMIGPMIAWPTIFVLCVGVLMFGSWVIFGIARGGTQAGNKSCENHYKKRNEYDKARAERGQRWAEKERRREAAVRKQMEYQRKLRLKRARRNWKRPIRSRRAIQKTQPTRRGQIQHASGSDDALFSPGIERLLETRNLSTL